MVLVFNVSNIFSQENAKHLTFKGVEIDGTLDRFVSKMQQKGFTYIGESSEVAILNGNFAGYRDCNLYIYPNGKGNVYMAGVCFPTSSSWTVLYSNYLSIKNMLLEKYGKPLFCTERFNSTVEPRDDKSKFYEAQMERCEYKTVFYFEEGMISVQISTVQMRCYVSLTYSDRSNSQEDKDAAKEDFVKMLVVALNNMY
ncbi:MAG: hypothetical protein J6P44_03945 [Bacteroidales bacterium]|nr:hypothetical protein [Bacteroidales bacterium]